MDKILNSITVAVGIMGFITLVLVSYRIYLEIQFHYPGAMF